MDARTFFGIIMLVYGIAKIVLVMLSFTLTKKQKEAMDKIPYSNIIFGKDTTLAFKFSEYVLLIFGIYSVMHGLGLLHVLPTIIEEFLDDLRVQYFVSFALGIPTTIFYVLVLYTNVPIEKDETNFGTYKVCLWGIGVSFLLFPILWELAKMLLPYLASMDKETAMMFMMMLMIGIMIIVTVIIMILFFVRKRKLFTMINKRFLDVNNLTTQFF